MYSQTGKQKMRNSLGRYRRTMKTQSKSIGQLKDGVLSMELPPGSIKRIQRHKATPGLCSVVVKRDQQHANYGRVSDDKENIRKRDFKEENMN